jgi:hypothetical protein
MAESGLGTITFIRKQRVRVEVELTLFRRHITWGAATLTSLQIFRNHYNRIVRLLLYTASAAHLDLCCVVRLGTLLVQARG